MKIMIFVTGDFDTKYNSSKIGKRDWDFVSSVTFPDKLQKLLIE